MSERNSKSRRSSGGAGTLRRLSDAEVTEYLSDWPRELREVALELRRLVLRVAPELDEQIAFDSLCYTVPGRLYGVIGGNACGIGRRGDAVHLGFLHGAFLADPQGLLRGSGKAKRHLELRSTRDILPEAFTELIRAAVAYDPST